MFITPTKPRKETASLQEDVLTFTASELAPWLLQLNQINAALFLHHQRLHDMSYSQMSSKVGWPQASSKPEPALHGLPLCGSESGYYSDVLTPENGVPALTEGQPSNQTWRPPSSSNASSYSTTSSETRVTCYSPSASVPAHSHLLDLPYWQPVPPGPGPLSPFAPKGGDPLWEHGQQGINPSLLEHGHHTLGVHTSMLPQTVFRPGETLHNLALSPLPEKDCIMPKLFAPSDLLQGMALDDEPNQSPWGVSSGPQAMYEGPRCVELTESDTTSSPWADDTAGEKTVSPQMLRLRHTPSPTSSSESLHTSFLADANANHSPIAFEQMPSPRRPRKLLPDHGRPLVPTNSMARYQPVVRSAPTSPRRRLVGFRPHARSVPTPSPPPPSMPAFSPGADGRQEIADRMAKNDFLVRQRQMGMSYKEIRRAGGFTEAESTLRGRYRTLTKSREARVRRPEWCEKDLRLLEKAVHQLAPGLDPNPSKIPWKRVAEYIVAHGGSYHFGNSTCRKRWDEMMRSSRRVAGESSEGGY